MENDAGAMIRLSLSRANRLILGGVGSTLDVLRKADAQLSKKLHAIAKRRGGGEARFTESSALLYREQIRLVTEYVKLRMGGLTDAQAGEAIAEAVKSAVALATRLEERFTGITRPLNIHSQAIQDDVARGTGASLIRQREASWERYGAAMTTKFETVLRAGSLMGMTNHDVISRLVQTGELGGINAARLHEESPGSFPEPTGYVNERYWAERIVRTETAYAYNAAALNTMQTAKNVDFPDLQKKILAHFDVRTAPDSVAVHGQIRPLDGYFRDGAGREYLHPPGRPNDRESVIPWRKVWAELEETEQESESKVEAAIAEIQGREAAKAQRVQVREERRNTRKERTEARRAARAQAAAEREQRRQAKPKRASGMGEDTFTELLGKLGPRNEPVGLAEQREAIRALPSKLDNAQAARLVAKSLASVPVELAMRHPKLVAAFGHRLNVSDWGDSGVQDQVRSLAMMDPELIHATVHRDAKYSAFTGMFIGARPLPELDHLQSLLRDDQGPRGWGSGSVWEDVGGVAAGGHTCAVSSVKSWKDSTSLHEFGHIIGSRVRDRQTGTFLDHSSELREHNRRLYPKLSAYYQQDGPGGTAGTEEMFAESMSVFYRHGRQIFLEKYDAEYLRWLEKQIDQIKSE